MAMAEKLSVQQLQQAVQSGSLPAYIGIPLIEQKTKEKAQMAAAQGGQQKPPSVAASILQQAEQQEMQDQGIDRLPSNLPVMDDQEMGMAGGGIVAFAGEDGSLVEEDVDVLERMRIEDPEAYERITYGITRERGPSSGQPQQGRPKLAPAAQFIRDKFRAFRDNPFADTRLKFEGSPRIESPAQSELDTANATAQLRTQPIPPRQPNAALDTQMLADSFNQPTSRQGAQGAASTGAANTQGGGRGTPQTTAQPSQAQPSQPAQKSALDQYAEMLMKEREGSGKERDKAKAMAILQAGLGIMGGTSPNAFANIAQGVLPATQGYQQEIKGIRREDAARIKELMGLGVSKEKLALEAKKLGISERRFDQMYELETQKIGIMGGSRADSRAQAEELRRLSVAQGLFATLRKDQLMSGLSDEQLWSQAQRMAGQAGVTEPASSGTTIDWNKLGKK
jgi:hypothetical protein